MDYLHLIDEHEQTINAMKTECLTDISRFAEACREAIASGHTIYLMGNGGSACDCQHFAAELVGRFQKERQAMASVALTTDTSILTALANDYGFEVVFSRQVEALVRAGDVVVGLSTSGSSPNILRGLAKAKEKGAFTVGMTGRSGGKMKSLCDVCICIPSDVTARIQEAHLLVEHLVCQRIED
ncbi:MAG TPA: D-sedoheptulose 7-phosphate isomerase [Negativicutes bacterium]|nr:D-sedoheptulose 7-phosphate isomerase [Negativicutes bacterium]